MEYDVSFDGHNKIVIFTVTGELFLEDAFTICKHAAEIFHEKNLHRTIVDLRDCDDMTSVTDNVIIARRWEEMGLKKTDRMVILHREDDTDLQSFFETKSQNVGNQVRAFKNQKDAVEWLIEE